MDALTAQLETTRLSGGGKRGKPSAEDVAFVIEEANHLFSRANIEELNRHEKALGLPVSSSVTQARKQLATVHINIFDLVAQRYVVHKSVIALAYYTQKNHLFFPLEKAKADELRFFLRQLNQALKRAAALKKNAAT